jgi:hypothetical protein
MSVTSEAVEDVRGADADGPEYAEEEVRAPAKKKLDKGFQRNILIIGAVVGACALLVAMLFVLNRGKEVAATGGADVNIRATTEKNTGDVSPQMAEKVREVQALEAEQSRREGKPYIPADQLGSVEVLKADGRFEAKPESFAHTFNTTGSPAASHGYEPGSGPESEEKREEAERERQAQQQARQQAIEAEHAAKKAEMLAIDERRRQGLIRQLGVVFNDPNHLDIQRIAAVENRSGSDGGNAYGQGSSASGSGSGGVSGGGSGQVAAAVKLVDALEIFAAETRSPVDTYRSNYVSASIYGGKLSGAFLTGTVTLQEEGLMARFTRMRWRDQTYTINAQWLDQATATDVADANIDRRLLQRFVLPVVMAAGGAYANARSQTGATTVVGSVGGTTTQTPAPTSDQARAAGVAAAFQVLNERAQAAAAKPEQAKLPAQSPVGIMFMEPVMAAMPGPQAGVGTPGVGTPGANR